MSHAWSGLWVAQQIERRIRQDSAAETFIDAFDIAKGDDFEERIFGEMRHIAQGDWLYATKMPDGSVRLAAYDPHHEEVMEIAREVMKEYRDTFKAIAK